MNANDIAIQIADQMTNKDIAHFESRAWRSGVSDMLIGEWAGADLDEVMGSLKHIVMDRFLAMFHGDARSALSNYEQPADAETDHFADDVLTWNRLAGLRA